MKWTRIAVVVVATLIAGYACVHTGNRPQEHSAVADEVTPLLVEHLPQGKSAAALKAFYKRLGQSRIQQLTRQVLGLAKSAANL